MQVSPRLDDDRATMSPLSHVLTMAITTLLIVGLTVGASGLLQDERQSAAREDLRTVGNRLASELAHADQLAQGGGSATIESTHTERIAGNSYDAELLHGPVCDRTRIAAATCLRLTVEGMDVTEYVPVSNESAVSLEASTSGHFVLTAELGSANSRENVVVTQDRSTRIGIGEDITRSGELVGGALGNQPPLADFEFEPTSPQSGQEVQFNASHSVDPDGTIDTYEWDFDGDGTPDETTSDPIVNHTFSQGGNYYVDLRVTDEDGASSNLTRFIDVSGLVYNDDLSTGSSSNDVTFTVRNNFGEQITLTHALVDPSDDSISNVNASDGSWSDDISISAPGDTGGDWVQYGFELYTDGRIRQLDDTVELDPNDVATVEISGFHRGTTPANMNGAELRLGLKYEVGDRTNSTRVTDTVGGPLLTNYGLQESGGDVHLRFESTEELDTISVTLGGDASGSLDQSDFTETSTGSGYVYETDSPIATSPGIYWARLTTAETSSGVSSGQMPLNDSLAVADPSGEYVWTTAGDWDNEDSSSGIVHASFGDHSADRVELGYSNFDEGGSNLVGYWPLDGQAGGTAADESGLNNHGTVEGDPGMTPGVGASGAYALDGSGDYVRIPYDTVFEVDDEQAVTVSAWVRKSSPQWGDIGIFQNSDFSYNIQFKNGNEPAFSMYEATDGYTLTTDGSSVSAGQWVHVVGVYDGSTAELYRDGSSVASESADDIDANSDDGDSDDLGIGANLDDARGQRNMDGTIDEVRVYDRALSPGEVQTLAETPTQGNMTTGWQTGTQYQQNDVELQYDVDVESGEEVWVRVVGEQTGTGSNQRDESDWIVIDSSDPGSGTVAVSDLNGLGNNAGRFRLEIGLTSGTVSGSPTVNTLALEETP